MRKICLLLLVLFSVNSSVFAESFKDNSDLSIGINFGMLSGVTEEIVYINGASMLKLSQLDWEFKPLFYTGLDLLFNWQSGSSKIGFFSNADLKIGIPMKTGIMGDRDWTPDINNPTFSTYPHWLVYYSESNNYTNFALLADFDIGVSFKLANDLGLKAFVSYNFMHFYWEAKGGSYLFPGDHNPWPQTETVITYRQYWHIVSPGVSFFGKFNRLFDLELFFKITPLTWLYSVDNHLLRDLIFVDKPRFGLFLEPGLFFNFRTGTFVNLYFSYSYRFITGARGDGIKNDTEVYPNTSGAAFSAHDIGLFASISLF